MVERIRWPGRNTLLDRNEGAIYRTVHHLAG